MKVGTNHNGYPSKRNIINLPFKNTRVVKIIDLFKIFTHIYFKLLKKSHQISLNSFFDFGLNKAEVNHFFNGISYSNTPWITTFETSLPRYSNASKFWFNVGVKRLAHTSCKQLIALSENAKQIQLGYIKENYPDYLEIISKKIEVLHPAQKLQIESLEEKKTIDNKIVFTLIGNQFFSKGGRESFNVINRFVLEGFEVELNIVSGMDTDMYASMTTEEDIDIWLPKIKNSEGIIFHGRLKYTDVEKLYFKTDVVLLPTYADTYGYSVLEAQASGCPVITTDIRALPEINNDDVGWVIKVPRDKNGNAILSTKQDRERISSIIEYELYRIIKEEIMLNKDLIKIKGERALERIRKHHNPNDKAEILEEIYRKALSRK